MIKRVGGEKMKMREHIIMGSVYLRYLPMLPVFMYFFFMHIHFSRGRKINFKRGDVIYDVKYRHTEAISLCVCVCDINVSIVLSAINYEIPYVIIQNSLSKRNRQSKTIK